MSVRFEKNLNHAFVLDEKTLKRIAEILENEVGEMNVKVICSDDGVRTFESIQDLLSYENHRNSKILSIELDAGSLYASSKNNNIEGIEVSFRQDAMSLTVKGLEPHASQCKDNLCDILAGTKPWYWWISDRGFSFFHGLFLFFLTLYLIPDVYTNWGVDVVTKSEVVLAFKIILIVISGIFLSFPFAWIMTRVCRYTFPSSQFLIGQEKQKASHQEWIRGLIAVTVITIFAGGILKMLGF